MSFQITTIYRLIIINKKRFNKYRENIPNGFYFLKFIMSLILQYIKLTYMIISFYKTIKCSIDTASSTRSSSLCSTAPFDGDHVNIITHNSRVVYEIKITINWDNLVYEDNLNLLISEFFPQYDSSYIQTFINEISVCLKEKIGLYIRIPKGQTINTITKEIQDKILEVLATRLAVIFEKRNKKFVKDELLKSVTLSFISITAKVLKAFCISLTKHRALNFDLGLQEILDSINPTEKLDIFLDKIMNLIESNIQQDQESLKTTFHSFVKKTDKLLNKQVTDFNIYLDRIKDFLQLCIDNVNLVNIDEVRIFIDNNTQEPTSKHNALYNETLDKSIDDIINVFFYDKRYQSYLSRLKPHYIYLCESYFQAHEDHLTIMRSIKKRIYDITNDFKNRRKSCMVRIYSIFQTKFLKTVLVLENKYLKHFNENEIDNLKQKNAKAVADFGNRLKEDCLIIDHLEKEIVFSNVFYAVNELDLLMQSNQEKNQNVSKEIFCRLNNLNLRYILAHQIYVLKGVAEFIECLFSEEPLKTKGIFNFEKNISSTHINTINNIKKLSEVLYSKYHQQKENKKSKIPVKKIFKQKNEKDARRRDLFTDNNIFDVVPNKIPKNNYKPKSQSVPKDTQIIKLALKAVEDFFLNCIAEVDAQKQETEYNFAHAINTSLKELQEIVLSVSGNDIILSNLFAQYFKYIGHDKFTSLIFSLVNIIKTSNIIKNNYMDYIYFIEFIISHLIISCEAEYDDTRMLSSKGEYKKVHTFDDNIVFSMIVELMLSNVYLSTLIKSHYDIILAYNETKNKLNLPINSLTPAFYHYLKHIRTTKQKISPKEYFNSLNL
ncbi:hypothetical protein CDIK_0380 [Cucumispora dikerogammari]|nr:hypothetical protein CDIK_0380 [Cucumispora dikerogammari]